MIQVSKENLQQIQTHAERIYPEECCGLLLGEVCESCKIVIEVYETENSWDAEAAESFTGVGNQGSKRNRFSIAPEVMLQVQREIRDRNLAIIGIYHSHPDHTAIPSEFDRAIAWQQYSYLIIAVQQGKVETIRSWQLDESHQFQPEEIINK